MSTYHQIFLSTSGSEEQLVHDVAAAADCEMRRLDTGEGPIAYAGRTRGVAVEIELTHGYEDDLGIEFSRYPIVVTLRSFESDKAREEEIGRNIFHKLAETGHYSVMLVFDLYKILNTFTK